MRKHAGAGDEKEPDLRVLPVVGGQLTKLALSVALAVAFCVSEAAAQVSGSHASAADRCRVSSTSSHPVPGRRSFNFGTTRIAVDLPKGARFVAIPDGSPRGGWAFVQTDGWIRTKFGWFASRGARRITGRRVDGTGVDSARIGPLSFTSNGSFYPSLIYFSVVRLLANHCGSRGRAPHRDRHGDANKA